MNIPSLYPTQFDRMEKMYANNLNRKSSLYAANFSGSDIVTISDQARAKLLEMQNTTSLHQEPLALFKKKASGSAFDSPWGKTDKLPFGDQMIQLPDGKVVNAWTPIQGENGKESPAWWKYAKKWEPSMWEGYCVMSGTDPGGDSAIDSNGNPILNPVENSEFKTKLVAIRTPFTLNEGGYNSPHLSKTDKILSRHYNHYAKALNELGLNPPPDGMTPEEQNNMIQQLEKNFYERVRNDSELMNTIKESIPFLYHHLNTV